MPHLSDELKERISIMLDRIVDEATDEELHLINDFVEEQKKDETSGILELLQYCGQFKKW